MAGEYKPTGVAPSKDSYIFGAHPYVSPQELFAAYEPIMRYLEKAVPGSHFEIEASRDYPEFEAKLAARHFDFALPNPAEAAPVIGDGYHVIAKMTPDTDFRGLIVARADSHLASPGDLSGKSLCFPSATALAATLQPLLWLHDQGVDVKKLKIHYVGSQFSSILNAWSGDYAACCTSPRFFRAWQRANPDKSRDVRVFWQTPSLPHNPVIVRDDVPAPVAEAVARALIRLDKDPAVDQSQFRYDQQHFESANDDTYKPVVQFLRRYDQEIGLPARIKLPRDR